MSYNACNGTSVSQLASIGVGASAVAVGSTVGVSVGVGDALGDELVGVGAMGSPSTQPARAAVIATPSASVTVKRAADALVLRGRGIPPFLISVPD